MNLTVNAFGDKCMTGAILKSYPNLSTSTITPLIHEFLYI